MQSVKDAMKWDEDVFGLEYDLDVYNIVAVGDFNMGAMENKGLNVFNIGFLSQLNRIIAEGPDLHHWLEIDTRYTRKRKPILDRSVGRYDLHEGEGDYGDFQGLVGVATSRRT